jgi:hypothetical protein
MSRRLTALVLVLLVLVKGSPASAKVRPASKYTGPGMKRVCPIAMRYRQEIDIQINYPRQQVTESLLASLQVNQSNTNAPAAERLADEGEPFPTGDVLLLSMRLLI